MRKTLPLKRKVLLSPSSSLMHRMEHWCDGISQAAIMHHEEATCQGRDWHSKGSWGPEPRGLWAGAQNPSLRSVAGRFQGSSAWSLIQLSLPLALTQLLAACAFLQRNLSGASYLRMENASLGAPLNSGGPLPLICLGSAVSGGRERTRPSFMVPPPCPSIH